MASRRILLAAGLSALAIGAAASPHAPPLYDGLGSPDEPYRYAQVLADDPVKTPPPTRATQVFVPAQDLGATFASAESGPQISVYVPPGAIHAAQQVTLTATPLAPDPVPPADGPIAGNVYRLAATPQAAWIKGRPGTISLRSPQGIPVQPQMEFRPGPAAGWRAVATTRTGNDIWEAALSDLGDYALVLPVHAARPATGQGHTGLIAGLAGGAGAVVVLIIAIRLTRRRGQEDAAD